MEDFRRQFSLETVETLENLKHNLQSAKNFSDFQRREIFRTLHTVKGTAQTFGYVAANRLAHELEDLLSAGDSELVLIEGFELLIKSLTETNFVVPQEFAEKIRAAPSVTEMPEIFTDYSAEIPVEILSQLTSHEKQVLRAATRAGRNLACLEIGFELAAFADELISLREILNASGDIVATFPSAKFAGTGKIGFRFLLTTTAKIEKISEKTKADVWWSFSPENSVNDARGILRQVARHGREVAAKLGKRVEIKIQAEEITLSPTVLKLIFDISTHLVRNAVDHAIENVGEVIIVLTADEKNLRLLVSDNGRGIDSELVKAKAIEKKLIAGDQHLSEQETLDLIFTSEFSTKSSVTEISGRGVGLDAVKYGVEKNGGKITIATRYGRGTTFEIFVPRQSGEKNRSSAI